MRGSTPWIALLLVFGGELRAEESAAKAEIDQREPSPFKISLSAEYRKLAISDEDPLNDQMMVYRFAGQGRVMKGLKSYIRFGLYEKFVAQEDESGLKFQDTQLGLKMATPISLSEEQELSIAQDLRVYLPTSRPSQKQDLFLALRYTSNFGLELPLGISLALMPHYRYRFHKFAERAGYQGGMNTQMDTGLHLGLNWEFLNSKQLGDLSFGASFGWVWLRKYDSRDEHETSTSDQGFWYQSYDWEAHLAYQPLKQLQLSLSLEHGGSVLRDGIVNTFFTHRDETELVSSLSLSF